ncbi:hypothetical protein GH714_010776 [Hevea brasiliensis]|uniref:WRKY19-like zinc finger domain-containing protein n=1 Tax=Hevea brasiliensis TaxID=3981 RepID=A0A6A6MN37_HEVBR|nr:hypothetical protein GH714_010776 [Hevea brasiliensis]
MENKFRNLGFASNYPSNAFKILGKSMQIEGAVAEYSADTVLRLDSPGSSLTYMSPSKGIKRKWNLIDRSMGQRVGSSLSLGLGRSSSSSESKGSSATACTTMSSAKETDEESSMDLELDFSFHLGNEKMSSPKKYASSNLKELELLPKIDLELSLSTGHPNLTLLVSIHTQTPLHLNLAWRCHLLLVGHQMLRDVEREPEVLLAIVFPMVVAEDVRNQAATRELRAGLCSARPMGVAGDVNFLVAQKAQKVAQTFVLPMVVVEDAVMRVVLGLQEENQDCAFGMVVGRDVRKKIAQKVLKAYQACAFHMEVVVEATGCTKGAQGCTMFCKAHGGGKRCTAPGCTKGAEGSTPFCKGHGGEKVCLPRMWQERPGSTDFCKAHGGGKRCSWGHPGSEYGVQPTGPCNSFARGKTGLCALHSGLVQDKRVHGGVTLGPIIQDPKVSQPEKMKEAVIAEDMNVDTVKMGTNIVALASKTTSDMKTFGVPNSHTPVGEPGLPRCQSLYQKAGCMVEV